MARGELRERTAGQYVQNLEHAKPLFNRQLRRLEVCDVLNWYDQLVIVPARSGDGKPSRNAPVLALATLRRCFAWARQAGLCNLNPAADLGKRFDFEPGEPLELEEVARYAQALDALNDRRQAREWKRFKPSNYLEALRGPIVVLYLLLLTGARLGEITNARLEQLDPAVTKIVILRGKNRRKRIIHLSTLAQRLVREQRERAQRLHSDFLFPSPANFQKAVNKSTVWNTFKRAMAMAGIRRRSPHDLRHTFATQLQLMEVPHEVIAGALGHHNKRSLEWYLHAGEEPAVRRIFTSYEHHLQAVIRG